MSARLYMTAILRFSLDLARTVFLSRTQPISLLLSGAFFVMALVSKELVIQAILASISASFMFSFVFFFFEACIVTLDRRQFRLLFGNAAMKHETYLVYPSFVLSQGAQEALAAHNEQLIYGKPHPRFAKTYRVDVPSVVAENDLRGLAYLVGLFGDTCGKAPPIRDDNDAVAHPHHSFIALGLTSNECTHMYQQHCSFPAFEIIPDEQGSEYLAYEDVSGKRVELKRTRTPGSGESAFYGVIIKYHPDPEEAPDRVWFLCAGLGPNGTSGAAWYLANRWRKLYKHVHASDFLAIIKVQHYADSDSSLFDWKVCAPVLTRIASREEALARTSGAQA